MSRSSLGPAAVQELPSLTDESLLRALPTTARGVRTRAALVAAARSVFERDGYVDARLADIATEAACSIGTFYTYFGGKDEAFNAVLQSVQDEMLHPGPAEQRDGGADPYSVIEAGNAAYLRSYRKNSELMRLLEEVSVIDTRFREARRRRNQAFVERNARSIARLQERGIADPSLDPLHTSRALSAMVSRVAYHTYCVEDAQIAVEDLTKVLTRLWANAIKLQP